MNTREYEWNDVTVMLGGADLTNIRGIKYSSKQEKEAIYGKGNQPVSIQKGNVSYEGEMTVLQSEYEAMRDASDTGSILDLCVDCVVCYGNPSQGTPMTTDTLLGVQFTEEPKEMKQGDKFQEITLPFIYLRQMKG